MSIDSEQTRSVLPVAMVSPTTAFDCLDRLTVEDRISQKIRLTGPVNHIGNGPVPLNRMLAIASEWGWEIDAIRLDWKQLQAAIMQNDVLLVLQNSNVVTAVENTRGGSEEILISDPLHQNGKPFLLPRGVLERAWQGDALIAKRNLQSLRYFTIERTVAFALASVAAIAFAAYLATKENVSGSVPTTHNEASNETTTKNISLADNLDRSPSRAIPLSMALAGKTTLSPNAVEQIQSSAPPADGTRVRVKDDSLEKPAGGSKDTPKAQSEESVEWVGDALPIAPAGLGLGSELVANSDVSANTAKPADQEVTTPAPTNSYSIDTAGPAEIDAKQLSMASAGKTTVSPSAVEQVQSSAPPADGTRARLGHDSLEQPASVSKMPEQAPQVVSPVASPAATAGAVMGAELEDLPMVVPLDAWLVVQAAKAAPTNDASSAPGKPDRVPQKTHAEDSDLLDRGDALISRGDIASARLYYQRAADAGSAQGALRLGQTYDPAFLAILGVGEHSGDVSIAAEWYQRAVELGAPEARVLLESSGGKRSTVGGSNRP